MRSSAPPGGWSPKTRNRPGSVREPGCAVPTGDPAPAAEALGTPVNACARRCSPVDGWVSTRWLWYIDGLDYFRVSDAREVIENWEETDPAGIRRLTWEQPGSFLRAVSIAATLYAGAVWLPPWVIVRAMLASGLQAVLRGTTRDDAVAMGECALDVLRHSLLPQFQVTPHSASHIRNLVSRWLSCVSRILVSSSEWRRRLSFQKRRNGRRAWRACRARDGEISSSGVGAGTSPRGWRWRGASRSSDMMMNRTVKRRLPHRWCWRPAAGYRSVRAGSGPRDELDILAAREGHCIGVYERMLRKGRQHCIVIETRSEGTLLRST